MTRSAAVADDLVQETFRKVLEKPPRAVLLLRDVFDHSVKEAATALDISDDDVKTTHLRARRAMEAYEANRRPTPAVKQRNKAALDKLVEALLEVDDAGKISRVFNVADAKLRRLLPHPPAPAV